MKNNDEFIDYHHLKTIAQSFDTSLQCQLNKINQYSYLPKDVLNDEELELLYKIKIDSGQKKFKKFINPEKGKKLLDIGCYMNLITYKYYKWDSIYYGIDISEGVIKNLKKIADKKRIRYAFLGCAMAHKLPFINNYFDYITCINVFEYFDDIYASLVIDEMYRVLNNKGKVIIDIPNPNHKCFKIMLKVEKYFNRENKFIYGSNLFEQLISNKFKILKKDSSDLMIQYFMIKLEGEI